MKAKHITKISMAIIVLLVLLGVGIGLVAYFTHGFDFSNPDVADPSGDPSGTLLLTIGGKEYTAGEVLPYQAALRVDINAADFTVEVLPSGDVTFDFRHNGTLVKFPYIDGNFNEAFGIELGDSFFTINTDNRSMAKILESFYPEEEITDMTALDGAATYFVLRVTGNGKTIDIPLTGFYEYLQITITPEEIIF